MSRSDSTPDPTPLDPRSARDVSPEIRSIPLVRFANAHGWWPTVADQQPSAIADQPPPVPNDRPAIADLVIADMAERKRLGIQRYGVALQAHNGRDALVDLYQELLDACCYVRQLIEKRSPDPVTTSRQERAAAIDAAHLERQRDFSVRTFGPGPRTTGVLDHIRKELAEIEADPLDLGEWVDVVILALDGAWRSGHEPQEILDAIVAKQARNEARVWPDWRTVPRDQAIEHDRNVKE